MASEMKKAEYPFAVRIETSTGQAVDVPMAFLTPEEVAKFLQFDFKRLVQEAGVHGARVQVEQAMTADYDKVLSEVAACLRRGALKAV